ncbi:hypothetical protein BT93_C1051 [Corymbia citriodora subsp. variegata]|nr:hypothetical protein BT93_C1051 [Corymbia citriodora subsp. variegata]
MDPGDCPDSGGRPEGAADSEMTTDSFPEDAQKVDTSESAEGQGDSSSARVDLDDDDILTADGSVVVVGSKSSEPYFLFKRALTQRVSKEELGTYGGKLIVIAVHAVMQESGFIALDPVTEMPADRLCRNSVSFRYSLPELVARSLNTPECVLLTYKRLGHFVTVYGSLAKAKWGLPRILAGSPEVCCLDMRRYLWMKGDDDDMEANEDVGFSSSYPVKKMLEFWKIVKGRLASPLLLDLTEGTGLSPPSYFTYLPPELKLKIFESLPGIDLARVGCVCSELRYLTSSNDLWKQKYADEFGSKPVYLDLFRRINWKQNFARQWKKREKRRRRQRRSLHRDIFLSRARRLRLARAERLE